MAFIYAVYLDALVMENVLLDSVSLLCVGLWCEKPLRIKRLVPGVAVGVVLGILCFLWVRNFILYLIFVFLLVNPIMLQLSFGPMKLWDFTRVYGCCILTNFILGGSMNLLRQMVPEDRYRWILPISCAGVIFLVILMVLYKGKDDIYVKVSVLIRGQVKSMCALRDTGNCLKDVLTGRPVCIVSEELCTELMLSEESLRPISYETVAGKDTLYIYPVSKFYVMQKGEMIEQRDIMLGFGKKSLFQGKKYQMILHKEFC